MARRNSRFVNQKVIIGNKSIQASDLTDSARDALGADSDFVKTVKNFPGGNITTSSISPSAIADQDQLVASTGALTTGGILTISRDGGNSFINFDSNRQLDGAEDSSLNVFSTPNGFDIYTKTNLGAAPTYQGSTPLTTSSKMKIHLKTPVQNQQDLLLFFNVNAGAETDEIHSVQIFDSATENDYDYALRDEEGILHYLNLLDSIPYGDPRLSTAGGNNEVDIIGGRRLWEGIKGAKLANAAPEFTHVLDSYSNESIRTIGSRLRFRTRKSVPSEITGGAPATYKTSTNSGPEGPLGIGVSSPVYSLVSPRFVYKVIHATPMQGGIYGYTMGHLLGWPGNINSVGEPSNSSDTTIQQQTRQKFPFAGPSVYSYISGGDAPAQAIGGVGHSTFAKGYSTGNGSPGSPSPASYPGSNFFEFAFASETNVTLHPETASDVWGENKSAQQSNTHGYTMGGRLGIPGPVAPTFNNPSNSPSGGTDVKRQKFPFSGPAQYAYISGDLAAPATAGVGHSTNTKGYNTAGGNPDSGSYPYSVNVEFPFATEVIVAHPPSFNDIFGHSKTAQQSDTYGYTMGGYFSHPGNMPGGERASLFPTYSNPGNLTPTRRQKFPFAGPSQYAYISGGDLSTQANNGVGHSSYSQGYSTGSAPSQANGSYPSAEFFQFAFASETNVTLHPTAANDQWGAASSGQWL